MPPMSPLLNFLNARVEILVLNERTGLLRGSEEFQALEEAAVTAIERMCKGIRAVTAPELSELLGIVSRAPLTPDNQGRLRDTFNSLLDGRADGPSL